MAWRIPENPTLGEILGMGGSCYVSFVDDKTVHKSHQVWVNGRRQSYLSQSAEDDIRREAEILQHLGPHPCITAFYGVDEIVPGVHALRLERAPLGSLRGYIQTHVDKPPPENIRLRMSMNVAQGLAYAHSRGVRHCDTSCRNLLLFDEHDPRVKICDWGGSVIEGHTLYNKCGTLEEMQYELPCRGRELSKRPLLEREIFALGSAMYEIMAWARPFQGLSDDEVEERYAREEFACLDGIVIAEIINKCWHEQYGSVQDVVEALGVFVV